MSFKKASPYLQEGQLIESVVLQVKANLISFFFSDPLPLMLFFSFVKLQGFVHFTFDFSEKLVIKHAFVEATYNAATYIFTGTKITTIKKY